MTSNQNQDREAVARRAYELYLSRGGNHGNDQSDWLRAEAEIMAGNGSRKNTSASTGATTSTSAPIIQQSAVAAEDSTKTARPAAKSPRATKTTSLRK